MSTLPEDAPPPPLPPRPVPTAGTVMRPPTPEASSEPEIIDKHDENLPTTSHALAEESINVAPEEKGAAQVEHGDIEVRNLGWNDEAKNVPQPVVGGLKNEELWTLIRRFNKHILHVKRIDTPPLAGLDMNIADEEEFSPEKLRSQLERLYMVVIVSLFAFWKQVVRLRSWKETRRTATFLGVYSVAWFFDMLTPIVIAFLMVLILYPPAREYCFPPAPPSLIDSKTGGVQKPPAGVLASDDSMTGAPEKNKGEAVEQEAHSFVNSISAVCSGLVVSTAAGKHPQADQDDDHAAPDPTQLTENVSNAKDRTIGNEPTMKHDKTRKPVSNAVWAKARPTMHMIADVVDTWERFGNALTPTAPFPQERPRLILAGAFLPLLIGSYVTSSYILIKSMGFFIGFGFFGDPIISPTLSLINRTYPRWERYVELRNTLLRGIPTNAQLTITLLRIGERNKAPIPPPPISNVPPPKEPHATAGQGLEHLGATDLEIHEAVQADSSPDEDDVKEMRERKHPKSHRLMNLLRNTAKGGVHTALAADKAKAKVGSHHAKNRLGAVKPDGPLPATGPIRFPARFNGKKGHVYITATATTPAVSWTSDIQDVDPAWTASIGEVEEVKKVGGLGWKSKIVVRWAMGREIVDGLVVRTRDGRELHLTAVAMRDDLFNRLIAMGTQMWEVW